MMRPPDALPDLRPAAESAEDVARADRYAQPGTLEHFLLKMGYMPSSEKQAEAMLVRIVRELEWYQRQEWLSSG